MFIVYGAFAIAADVLPNHKMQAQNLNRVLCWPLLLIIVLLLMKCRLWYRLICLKP